MCPGGTVVAATSEPGRVVTNGMSQYSRNERNANAGIVVGVTPETIIPATRWPASPSSATGKRAPSTAGGGTYAAPAQLVGDFLAGRPSTLGRSSRPTRPACTSTDLATCLPDYAIAAIREALPAFDRQIPGFAMARCGADRRGDPHLLAGAHQPQR